MNFSQNSPESVKSLLEQAFSVPFELGFLFQSSAKKKADNVVEYISSALNSQDSLKKVIKQMPDGIWTIELFENYYPLDIDNLEAFKTAFALNNCHTVQQILPVLKQILLSGLKDQKKSLNLLNFTLKYAVLKDVERDNVKLARVLIKANNLMLENLVSLEREIKKIVFSDLSKTKKLFLKLFLVQTRVFDIILSLDDKKSVERKSKLLAYEVVRLQNS